MIYVDTSVILAHLYAEDRRPPETLFEEPLVSSRLLSYETWTRVNREELDPDVTESASQLLARISFLELVPFALERALEPWPVPLRTLDALHVASLIYIRGRRLNVPLATYDARMSDAAAKLDIPLYPLES